MSVAIYPNSEALSHEAARYVVTIAQESIAAHGRFTLALAGGSTPKKLYTLLGKPPIGIRSTGPWSNFSGQTNAAFRMIMQKATASWLMRFCSVKFRLRLITFIACPLLQKISIRPHRHIHRKCNTSLALLAFPVLT